MADETENVDSTNDTEAETVETEAETAEVKAQKLEETNRKLFERAKKAELELRELKRKPLTTKPELDDEIVADVKELKLSEKKRQFGFKHGLSPEETDRLFRFAGETDPAEALKDSFFQAGLKETRREAKVASAIPSSSPGTIKVSGKTFAEMTPEEREKNWGKITKK
jgi:hypothetical protein